MAYSNYGAYVWKNGENISDECCDISCYLVDNKFVFENWYVDLINQCINENNTENENYDDKLNISGHAVINLEDFCISFYKTYNPVLYFLDGTRKEIDIEKRHDYTLKKKGFNTLYIRGYRLGTNTGYFFYEVDYRGDKYCIIIGSCIGKGWDSEPASKYVLKHLVLFERRDGIIRYRIKANTDIDIIFDKLDRLSDIKYEKYFIRHEIKGLFKDLIRFRFNGVAWYFQQLLEHYEKIKWLK